MSNNPIGFTIGAALSNDSCIKGADFDAVFVRSDCFNDGGLWLWGYNAFGQLGDNTTFDRSSPVQTIAGGTNWKEISAGYYHMAAIKTDGTLWAWGYNGKGQLGDNTLSNKSSPVQTAASGNSWKKISAGLFHTIALKTDGAIWSWGYNASGQLGDNTTTNRVSPGQLYGNNTCWRSVSSGWQHSAAIKTDGTLWLWGNNSCGQLGDFTTINKSSPVQTYSGGNTWKQVSTSNHVTTAIKTDGTLWAWGDGSLGQIGLNNYSNKLTPTQTGCNFTDWRRVSNTGSAVTAIKNDGTVWTWGYGPSCNCCSPGIKGDNPFRCAAGGFDSVALLCTDGRLLIGGSNNHGEVGDNTTIQKPQFVETISGGTSWRNISFGKYYSAAIRDNCW